MKKILTLIGAALLFAATSQAQGLVTYPAPSGFQVYNSQTTNLASPWRIDCTGQKDVAILLSFKLTGAGTEVQGFRFVPSVDGSTAAGSPLYAFAKAANGTTAVTISTNLTVSGYPYLILDYITNGTAGPLTNITLKYYAKKNAP